MAADVPYFTFNNGVKIPSVGLGYVQLEDAQMMVYWEVVWLQVLDGWSGWRGARGGDGETSPEGMRVPHWIVCANNLSWLSQPQLGYRHFDTVSCPLQSLVSENRFLIMGITVQWQAFGYGESSDRSQRGLCLISDSSSLGNEEHVGKAIRESGIPREDIFVVTKLTSVPFINRSTCLKLIDLCETYSAAHHAKVAEAFETSLKNLGLDYVDLYLMHWPQASDENGKQCQCSLSVCNKSLFLKIDIIFQVMCSNLISIRRS